jgi:hypothetical protein
MIHEQVSTNAFFIKELLDGFNLPPASQVRFKHPFACVPLQSSEGLWDALELLMKPLSAVQGEREYRQQGVASRCWTAEFQGNKINGVSAAFHDGGEVEIRLMISSFPSTFAWREEVLRNSGHMLPQSAWDLPAGTDLSIPRTDGEEDLDPKFPFQISQGISFYSPILVKPIIGSELVSRVVGHASAVYGERKYGPKIQAGRFIMSFWQGSVSGFPIEVANEIRLNEKMEVDKMVMSMQPWPAVKLFRERCIERTRNFLDLSYFQ